MTEPMHDAAGHAEGYASQPSPGAQLAARRQQFGWTVEQVASQINLAPRQIEAIEADDFAALPGMAVARGFVRAYAKLLKLDATPLMAQLGAAPSVAENTIPLRRTIAATSFTPHRPATRARRSGAGKLIAGVVVLALVGAGAYVALANSGAGAALAAKFSSHFSGAEKPAASGAEAPGNASTASVVETPATPRALADASGATASSGTAATPQLPAAATPQSAAAPVAPIPGSTVLTPSPSLTPPPATSAAPATVAASAAPAAPAATDKALVLKLREDSWVEIKRADNSVLVSRVMRAGSTESFDVAGPVTLIVGNVRGVDATLRGEALNLKSGTKNNVARIRVH